MLDRQLRYIAADGQFIRLLIFSRRLFRLWRSVNRERIEFLRRLHRQVLLHRFRSSVFLRRGRCRCCRLFALKRPLRRFNGAGRGFPLGRLIGPLRGAVGLLRRCRAFRRPGRRFCGLFDRRSGAFLHQIGLGAGADQLDAKTGVRKGLAQRLILGRFHEVAAVLGSLLGRAHTERLRVTAVQEYLGLKNRHLLRDPQRRQTHTAVGMGHAEPEFLVRQVQLQGVLGAAEELERVKARHLVQFSGRRHSFVHRFRIAVVHVIYSFLCNK